jgi:toxin ParE1/3/4
MDYKLEIRPLATIEIIEAHDWYELQREGLGLEFLDELERFYHSLLRNPHSYAYYNEPVREGKIARFPYTVVYEVVAASIVVYSAFMTSKDPSFKRIG